MDLLSNSDKNRLLSEISSLEERFGSAPLTNVRIGELSESDFDVLAVGSIVYDANNSVVLVRRAETPSEWVIPGGTVDPGEHVLDTVVREIREETGLDIEVSGILRVGLAPQFSPPAFRDVNRARFGKEAIGLLFVNFVSTGDGKLDCGGDPSNNILEVRAFKTVPFELITHVYKVLFVKEGRYLANLEDYPAVEFAPLEPIYITTDHN